MEAQEKMKSFSYFLEFKDICSGKFKPFLAIDRRYIYLNFKLYSSWLRERKKKKVVCLDVTTMFQSCTYWSCVVF